MSGAVGIELRRIFEDLARSADETVSETPAVCRVDGVTCGTPAMLTRLRDAAIAIGAGGFGKLEAIAQVAGELDLATVPFADIAAGKLSLRFEKAPREGWCCFLTVKGFRDALGDGLIATPACVAVAGTFAPFASMTMSVTTWDGPRSPPAPDAGKPPQRPRKFIRDLTDGLAPKSVEPWLLTVPPSQKSDVYAAWCEVAAQRLAYGLPSEFRDIEDEPKVVLKGPRSTPIDIADPPQGWGTKGIVILSEAASWIYVEEPKTAETRFLFLNNHLSLAWRDGDRWPEGLTSVLGEALVSAREAYGFHVEGETKEALKALGELRKNILEDVTKAQGATRDLISSLWRDFAIAGVVLAFRSPVAQSVTGGGGNLRYVAPATALMLVLSLVVTVLSNFVFAILANWAREDWRKKLYPFVTRTEWKKLVKTPIARTRWVYRFTLPVVAIFYAVAVWYLYTITDPTVVTEVSELLAQVRARIGV